MEPLAMEEFEKNRYSSFSMGSIWVGNVPRTADRLGSSFWVGWLSLPATQKCVSFAALFNILWEWK